MLGLLALRPASHSWKEYAANQADPNHTDYHNADGCAGGNGSAGGREDKGKSGIRHLDFGKAA